MRKTALLIATALLVTALTACSGNNGTGTKPISRAAQLEAQYHANLYGEAKKE